ncbi:MAG: type II toxin-antitoxin system VapB family antitoxin [Oligoflexia bacterium]|nr:type II toxin-antitoxin system VapB family antitoxin [Oligoflexia bacterium]MBF0366747.1 type II toxin-antitoxin system VapB family antitoxin [Oligoflexia bacterium]
MRTTLILKEELIKKAQEITGIKQKTALIHKGLELLIQREASKQLIKLGGSDRSAKCAKRRKVK